MLSRVTWLNVPPPCSLDNGLVFVPGGRSGLLVLPSSLSSSLVLLALDRGALHRPWVQLRLTAVSSSSSSASSFPAKIGSGAWACSADGKALACTAGNRMVTLWHLAAEDPSEEAGNGGGEVDFEEGEKVHVRYDVKALALCKVPSSYYLPQSSSSSLNNKNDNHDDHHEEKTASPPRTTTSPPPNSEKILLATASVRGAVVQVVGGDATTVITLALTFAICKIEFTPNASHLVLCANEGQVGVWSVADLLSQSSQRIALSRMHMQAQVTCMALTDTHLALSTWNAEKGVGHFLYSLDLKPIPLAVFDNESLETAMPKSTLCSPGFVAFSPCGQMLAATLPHTILIFSVNTGAIIKRWKLGTGQSEEICGLGVCSMNLADASHLFVVRQFSGVLCIFAWPTVDGRMLAPNSPWLERPPKLLKLPYGEVLITRGSIQHPKRTVLAPCLDAFICWANTMVVLLRNGQVHLFDEEGQNFQFSHPSLAAAAAAARAQIIPVNGGDAGFALWRPQVTIFKGPLMSSPPRAFLADNNSRTVKQAASSTALVDYLSLVHATFAEEQLLLRFQSVDNEFSEYNVNSKQWRFVAATAVD